MKLLITKTLTGVGRAGQIVEVKDAYARNFLIPNGFGRPATPSVLQAAENATRQAQVKQATQSAAWRQAQSTLEGADLGVQASASPNGRLFAAMRAEHVRSQLEQKYHLDLNGVKFIPDHWKETGKTSVIAVWPDGSRATFRLEISHD